MSPFEAMKQSKRGSQGSLKPKLKIMKSKEPQKTYYAQISNPFKKQFMGEFDYSSKHSGISPNSRMKAHEVSKEKKAKKKPSHKRVSSQLGGNIKSHPLLGRSQTAINDSNKGLKVL